MSLSDAAPLGSSEGVATILARLEEVLLCRARYSSTEDCVDASICCPWKGAAGFAVLETARVRARFVCSGSVSESSGIRKGTTERNDALVLGGLEGVCTIDAACFSPGDEVGWVDLDTVCAELEGYFSWEGVGAACCQERRARNVVVWGSCFGDEQKVESASEAERG